MKTRWIVGAAAAAGLALVAALLTTDTGVAIAGDEGPGTVTATFAVDGMTCGGCEAGVELKVRRLPGVESVEASYEESRATVTYRPEEVTPEAIVEAIEALGYSAELVAPDPEKGGDAPSGRSR